MTLPGVMCECDWEYHQGKPCPNEAADHGNIRTSPQYCIPCLHVCCGERDDAEEVTHERGRRRQADHEPTQASTATRRGAV